MSHPFDPLLESIVPGQAERREKGLCTTCGKPHTAFKDTPSEGESKISGMCQACQDSIEEEWQRPPDCGDGPHDCGDGLCGCYDCRECNPSNFCDQCTEYAEECQCAGDDDWNRDDDDGQPDEAQENNDFAHDDDPEPNTDGE